ncbi:MULTISPECIES: hypothetical protein [unclassified Enterococcus]|nr:MULTISPECIES: hypothetical protein [unclassified Enterococcus]
MGKQARLFLSDHQRHPAIISLSLFSGLHTVLIDAGTLIAYEMLR